MYAVSRARAAAAAPFKRKLMMPKYLNLGSIIIMRQTVHPYPFARRYGTAGRIIT